MIHGSCLCGKVRFELAGPPQFINHCHCSMCRKVHGAAFGSLSARRRARLSLAIG